MSETLDVKDPASLAAEYLDLVAKSEEYMDRAKLIKDNLIGLLPYEEWFTARYGPALVLWAKGRRMEKVDVKVAKRKLVLAGVTPEIVEAAFEAATTVSVGQPTMRVAHNDQEVR